MVVFGAALIRQFHQAHDTHRGWGFRKRWVDFLHKDTLPVAQLDGTLRGELLLILLGGLRWI